MTRAVLLAGLLIACAGDDPDVASSPCDDETRGGLLTVGDTFEADGVGVEVTALQPSTVEVGLNAWSLGLTGADGDCIVEVGTWMPDHGHGSSVGEVTSDGSTVDVADLEISMGGYWEVTLTVTCGEAEAVEVQMGLCVDA